MNEQKRLIQINDNWNESATMKEIIKKLQIEEWNKKLKIKGET